ncbi:MAG: hypothetical protein ACRD6W_13370, partial [Nitrososphaerales archaeon]
LFGRQRLHRWREARTTEWRGLRLVGWIGLRQFRRWLVLRQLGRWLVLDGHRLFGRFGFRRFDAGWHEDLGQRKLVGRFDFVRRRF